MDTTSSLPRDGDCLSLHFIRAHRFTAAFWVAQHEVLAAVSDQRANFMRPVQQLLLSAWLGLVVG